MQVSSNAYHFREFLESFVWRDLKNELTELRENVMESMAKEKDLDEVLRAQGRAEVLGDILILPEVILRELEEAEKFETETENDDELGEV